jgi:ABC-type dipeptide/oligopeptide/nickel transport system permease subunit
MAHAEIEIRTASAVGLPPVLEDRSYLSLVWTRLRRDRAAMFGAALAAAIILAALFAPLLAPHDPTEQFRDGLTAKGEPIGSTLLAGQGGRFPLGTDANGRDLLSRILYGARISLLVGVLANLMAVALGAAIGSVAGFFGGWAEEIQIIAGRNGVTRPLESQSVKSFAPLIAG